MRRNSSAKSHMRNLVIGVLVLQVLTSFLVGIGLEYEGQQFVFGLLIIPMVALYARSPHIRTQI